MTPADAEAFRALRLDALRGEPNGFAASLADEADLPLAWFAERLEANWVLASGDPLAGMVALGFDARIKRRHAAHLWGVFVRPEARGTGLARALVAAAVQEARTRVDHLRLAVDAANATAIGLYRSLGFVEYGLEPAGLRRDGIETDDLLMALDLRVSARG